MRTRTRAIVIYTLGITDLCTKSNYNPLVGDLKAAFGFKVGTYRVYKDSLTGQEDS